MVKRGNREKLWSSHTSISPRSMYIHTCLENTEQVLISFKPAKSLTVAEDACWLCGELVDAMTDEKN